MFYSEALAEMPVSVREEEKRWHEELYSARKAAGLVLPEKIKRRYLNPPTRPVFPLELMFRLVGDAAGRRVLCCGCGDENSTVLLALRGAEVWAVDISEEAVGIQRELAAANGIADRLRPVVCAAEELPFPDGYFDIVFGSAILHHLPDALGKISQELSRVVRADGFAVFSEPFCNSRLLRWLRAIVPVPLNVSPRERQLTADDLSLLRRHFFVELFPFHLLTRLGRFVLAGPIEDAPAWRRATIYSLHGLDWLLLRLPPLHRYAGVFVLKLRPKNTRMTTATR